MGLMDKVKASATQIADKAHEGIAAGQAKVEDTLAKRKADAMLLEIGGLVYTQRVGRAAGDVDTRLADLVSQLQAHEAEHGEVSVTSSAS